jgi:hypothetical protein
MICECTQAKPLFSCIEELTIGKMTEENTDYSVFFKNIITGRIDIIEVTSDDDGIIIADLSQFNPMVGHSYELWVTNAAAGIKDAQPIEINGDDYACLYVAFLKVNGDNVTSQTLEV